MNKLTLSHHNSKLMELAAFLGYSRSQVAAFDLPAGYTCPAAKECKSFAHRGTGRVIDSKGMLFRCYAASTESAFPSVRKMRWHNFDSLRSLNHGQMVYVLRTAIPDKLRVMRIHSSGDFFSPVYFSAWVAVAVSRPDVTFFGYTKMLPYLKTALALELANFKLVYSQGGAYDSQVTTEPVVYVVKTPQDAGTLGLPASCVENPADDYTHILAGHSFCIPLHGMQPTGRPKKHK